MTGRRSALRGGRQALALVVALLLALQACGDDGPTLRPGEPRDDERAEAIAALERGLEDILAHGDSMDDALRPLPLLLLPLQKVPP